MRRCRAAHATTRHAVAPAAQWARTTTRLDEDHTYVELGGDGGARLADRRHRAHTRVAGDADADPAREAGETVGGAESGLNRVCKGEAGEATGRGGWRMGDMGTERGWSVPSGE